MMVGQANLMNKLKDISLDSFPRSLILFGEDGCGKHSYCNLISNKLDLELKDITESITLETINDIYSRANPYLYIIDSSLISIKEQNMILKFIEEPLKNSYIILLCENKQSLLPTILNRCHIWHFESYSRAELDSFGIKDVYGIASTPGQLLELEGVDIDPIIKLVDSIIDRMANASISNALSISNKIAFKEEKDKFNLKLFNRVLMFRVFNRVKESSNSLILEMYKLVSSYINNSFTPRVDAKILLDNLIVNLWEVTHTYGTATT